VTVSPHIGSAALESSRFQTNKKGKGGQGIRKAGKIIEKMARCRGRFNKGGKNTSTKLNSESTSLAAQGTKKGEKSYQKRPCDDDYARQNQRHSRKNAKTSHKSLIRKEGEEIRSPHGEVAAEGEGRKVRNLRIRRDARIMRKEAWAF